MSYALEVAGKVALWVTLIAIVVGIGFAVSGTVADITSGAGSDISAMISSASVYFAQGRGLLNNFINGDVLNLCVALWFICWPIGFGAMIVRAVISHMRG